MMKLTLNLSLFLLALAAAVDASDNICSPIKKLTVFKFCFDGPSKLNDYTNHGLFLNGFLWEDTADIDWDQTGQCHHLGNDPRFVSADEALKVGIHSFDDFHEEDYSYTLPSSFWYSDSCEAYDIILSRENTGQWTGCWEPAGIAADLAPQAGPPGMANMRCPEGWEFPNDSFALYLRVEPHVVIDEVVGTSTVAQSASATSLDTVESKSRSSTVAPSTVDTSVIKVVIAGIVTIVLLRCTLLALLRWKNKKDFLFSISSFILGFLPCARPQNRKAGDTESQKSPAVASTYEYDSDDSSNDSPSRNLRAIAAEILYSERDSPDRLSSKV